eukprot:NODE_7552_length_433_cov_274.261905.p3 GENE.NODE_7552_length_433_cov_274.261905~~NODE_7552_length_433_cov_274.261905.p3  ORF type:complete len:65 (-),score=2.79 NODE_7552_length_433_cov_274.261905:124-318(-)
MVVDAIRLVQRVVELVWCCTVGGVPCVQAAASPMSGCLRWVTAPQILAVATGALSTAPPVQRIE